MPSLPKFIAMLITSKAMPWHLRYKTQKKTCHDMSLQQLENSNTKVQRTVVLRTR
jgi:hypothetical protein